MLSSSKSTTGESTLGFQLEVELTWCSQDSKLPVWKMQYRPSIYNTCRDPNPGVGDHIFCQTLYADPSLSFCKSVSDPVYRCTQPPGPSTLVFGHGGPLCLHVCLPGRAQTRGWNSFSGCTAPIFTSPTAEPHQ